MAKHTFKTSVPKSGLSVETAVTYKHPAEMSEAEAKKVLVQHWPNIMKSVVISVQTGIRTDLKNGIKGEALATKTQARFDAALSGAKAPAVTPLDYNAIKPPLNKAQVELMRAGGAIFVNVPENLK